MTLDTKDSGLASDTAATASRALNNKISRNLNAVAREVCQYILKISLPPNTDKISQRVVSIFQTIDGFLKRPSATALKPSHARISRTLERLDNNLTLDIEILERIHRYLDEMEVD